MKVQDIVFIILLLTVLSIRNPKMASVMGLFCIICAVPLFMFEIALFTAERLLIYATLFFSVTIVWYMIRVSQKNI